MDILEAEGSGEGDINLVGNKVGNKQICNHRIIPPDPGRIEDSISFDSAQTYLICSVDVGTGLEERFDDSEVAIPCCVDQILILQAQHMGRRCQERGKHHTNLQLM